MTDFYDWILSPEIREYLREHYPLSLEEKASIVCSAHRSLEEKYAVLTGLLEEAEAETDRDALEQLLRLWRWAFRELRRVHPGQVFTVSEQHTDGDVGHLKTRELVARMFHTYEEVLDYLRHMGETCNFSPWYCYSVEKWTPADDGLKEILYLDFYFIDGAFHPTMFQPFGYDKYDAYEKLQIGFTAETLHDWNWRFNDFPLPFRSGDLMRLDPPVLDEPVYGVLYVFDMPYDSRYMWFIYLQDDILNYCSVSHQAIDIDTVWRVIDWAHPAARSELPPGNEILVELSDAFREAGQNTADGEYLFSDLRDIMTVPVFRKSPLSLSDLFEEEDDGEKVDS